MRTPESKDSRQKYFKQKEKLIKHLAKEDSLTSTEFLAAICWHHADHGRLENLAFAAIEKRGKKAVKILVNLVKNAQSTCTIKSASHALARLRAPEAFDILIRILPGDIRLVFYIDAALALEILGDSRAVAHLVKVLNPDYRQPKSSRDEDPMDFGMGRQMARARAALALGNFDKRESIAALEKGVKNDQVSAYCHAGLYRLTRKSKHFAPVAKAIENDAGMDSYILVRYLERTGDRQAKTYVEKWKKKHPDQP